MLKRTILAAINAPATSARYLRLADHNFLSRAARPRPTPNKRPPTTTTTTTTTATTTSSPRARSRAGTPMQERVAPLASFLGVRSLEPGQVLELSREQLAELLGTDDYEVEQAMFEYADSVTQHFFGRKVYFRGIVELSNVCQKDCMYCGIRKHRQVPRYTMPRDEILQMAMWAFEHGYGTLMLQSGELPTPQRHQFIVDTIKQIKADTIARELQMREANGAGGSSTAHSTPAPCRSSSSASASSSPSSPKNTIDSAQFTAVRGTSGRVRGLGVALSLGELSEQWYRELFEAGAHRYLLRIESSNPELYKQLHPPDHLWERRLDCLLDLHKVGFQLGTGVMIGLPGQTLWDLAGDLEFFRLIGADMIGMGPYLPQDGTPIGDQWLARHASESSEQSAKYRTELFELSCRMIALSRITLGDVNISATTALQAINPIGREIALGRGANMLMPILTPTKYRENYQLYQGKPCIDEGHEECRNCLSTRVMFADKDLALFDWGDPPHYERVKLQPEQQHQSPQAQ